MLRVHRRIEKLEYELGVSDRTEPVEHRILFIDGDGTIDGTLVISHPSSAMRAGKYSRKSERKQQ